MTKTTTFDYARAWHDLAVPAYNRLPNSLRATWAAFQEADREILSERTGSRGERIVTPRMTQGPTLDTVGVPEGLRARMEAFSTFDLARASRSVYFCGHWDPGLTGGNLSGKFDRFGTGAHWKFASVCDQIIRARVFGADPEGAVYVNRDALPPQSLKACEIHEGMIRETFSDKDSWSWHEVKFAEDNYMANRVPRPSPHSTQRGGKRAAYDWQELEAFGGRCNAGEFATLDALPWLDTARFMVEDAGYQGFAKRDKFAAHKEAREARNWAARGGVTL